MFVLEICLFVCDGTGVFLQRYSRTPGAVPRAYRTHGSFGYRYFFLVEQNLKKFRLGVFFRYRTHISFSGTGMQEPTEVPGTGIICFTRTPGAGIIFYQRPRRSPRYGYGSCAELRRSGCRV